MMTPFTLSYACTVVERYQKIRNITALSGIIYIAEKIALL